VALAVAAFSALASSAAAAQSVPILFNDRHVRAAPDKLQAGRVLAALLRGGAVLVPLRSTFEQMGGTVTYDAATHTVDVSKPGTDVRVTVGRHEIVLNGETRPLDVPPEIYRGTVLVPVRVIAESLGAYVLWVADERLVAVRYVSARGQGPVASATTPTATPSATPRPAPPAAPSPTEDLTPTPVEGEPAQFFIVGDALFSPKLYDEFVPGSKGDTSLAGRAGVTVPANDLSILAEATVAQFRGPHGGARGFDTRAGCGGVFQPRAGDPSCVSVLGPASGSAYVAPFTVVDTDIDGRAGIGISSLKIYAIASFERLSGNYGYPALQGAGAGIEKLPDFQQIAGVYGSYVYYPQIGGTYATPFGPQRLRYIYSKYQAGITISPPALPVFLDVGFIGNHSVEKENAPGDRRESSAYAGLGVHF
jgi:hypothetical protein